MDTWVIWLITLYVTTDDLLEPKKSKRRSVKPSRKVLRRLERIEALPVHQQNAVLKSIDFMLRGIAS
jgi:hypothetical protein